MLADFEIREFRLLCRTRIKLISNTSKLSLWQIFNDFSQKLLFVQQNKFLNESKNMERQVQASELEKIENETNNIDFGMERTICN